MKKMLTVTNDAYVAARASVVLIIALALGLGFWAAMSPVAKAQQMSATEMLESKLPHGKTMVTASKSEFLTAVCGASKRWPSAAPQIVRAAIDAKKPWARDIVTTAIRCLPSDPKGQVCDGIVGIVDSAVAADPEDAAGITEMVIRLYPDCRDAIGHGGQGEGHGDTGHFVNPPPDVNPPPGSIGGGGGGFNPQETAIQVCRNGVTIIIFPSQIQPGDTIGPCVVTPVTNR